MLRTWPLLFVCVAACGSSGKSPAIDGPPNPGSDSGSGSGSGSDAGSGSGTDGEQAASDNMDAAIGDPVALAAFMRAMPKGGDLHNHLTGAVYAETYMDWGKTDGDCINSSTYAAQASCSGAQAMPTSGMPLYDTVIDNWSMRNYTGSDGHGHFFATFAKYGLVAGAHKNETLGDIATRAAGENEVYIETMFNLGRNIEDLASGTVTKDNLETVYDAVVGAGDDFDTALGKDVDSINNTYAAYRSELGCSGATPPAACDVEVRFVAQVARTGSGPEVFGQLIAAFEIAKVTDKLVAVNLSSPEDATASLNNYALHMAMLDFLHTKYAGGGSPLHVTLHAGELVTQYLPAGHTTDNTFHVHDAVITGHAERIGHGVDIASETGSAALMQTMHDTGVMVEVCLSSNAQILGVSGTAHPLAAYMAAGVPVALATDDQGVSRSSLAGEMVRAATDQHLTYRQIKLLGRTSLEHAFVPGASLWTDIAAATRVTDCADLASSACTAFTATSEKAALQVKLEQRYATFESQQ